MLQLDEIEQVLHENAEVFAALLAQEQPHEKDFESIGTRQKKICHELERNAHSLEQRIYDGFKAIVSALGRSPELPMSIDKFIRELRNCLRSIKSTKDFAQLGQNLLSDISWKAQLDISDQCLQMLYQGARALFEEKNYNLAEKAFFVICAFDPTQYAYWIGLGHSCFQERDYSQAINAYAMASTIDPENVWPHIWAANTFEKIKDFQYVKMALNNALSLLKSKTPKHTELISALEARLAHRV